MSRLGAQRPSLTQTNAAPLSAERLVRRDTWSWRDRRVLREGWPVAIICFGVPIGFFLGIGAFMWCVPAVLLPLAVLARPERWRVPKGMGALFSATMWVFLSGLVLSDANDLMLWGYRATLFLSTAMLYMFVANTSPKRLPTAAIIDWLAWFFIAIVILGTIGLVVGDLAIKSPLQMLMPGSIRNSGFMIEVSQLRFAEVQGFLGFPVPRPSAPFPYSNGWGSTMGLLAPFFFSAWVRSPNPRRRRWAIPIAGLAMIPTVISMNRGLWLSLFVGLVYVAVRRARAGDWRMGRNLVLGAVAAIALTVLTPLGGYVTGKFEGAGDSNEARSTVYTLAIDGAMQEPLFGHGVPTPREDGPPIGTHGLVWYLMYCHGFVALGMFTAWLIRVLWLGRGIRREPEVWVFLGVVIFAVQFPIYGLLPQLPLVGIAAGLVHRYVRPFTMTETR